MRKNNLYPSLDGAFYALGGANAEFIADLTKMIPFIPQLSWPRSGVLAVLPITRVKLLRRDLKKAKRRIRRHRSYVARLLREDRYSSDDYNKLLDLEDRYEDLKWELSDALT